MLAAERQRPQARIDTEAAEWLARHSLSGLTAAERAEFEAWSADPRHMAAFESMNRTLGDIAQLGHLAELEPLEAAPRRAFRTEGRRRAAVAIAGISAVAAATLAVVAAPGLFDTPDFARSTAVAEIRPMSLADGTRVTLGAKSRIEVQFDEGARRVKLTDGEAFFEVTHDPSRPFFVETGGTTVRVVGTKFDVKRIGDRVEVAVLQGKVQVRGRQVRTLSAGQQVASARILPLLPAGVGRVEAAATAPGAWRDGQLTYDDTKLSELVADLNRYYGPGVRLADRGLGDIRLAASFKVGEIDDFLRDLPAVADVAVTRGADGATTIGEK